MKRIVKGVLGSLLAFSVSAFAVDQDYNQQDGPAKGLTPPPSSSQWQSNSSAAPSMGYNRHRGFYVGGIMGINVVRLKVTKDNTTRYTKDGWEGFGWNGNVGYMFNNYFGVEAGLSQYATSLFAIDGALRGVWPIRQRWNVFAKLGLTSVFTSYIPGSLVLPYLGFGTGYAFTPNLEATLQVTGLTFTGGLGGYDGDADLGLIGVGITYYF